MQDIAGWENFYIIVGPAAGALIGLQFVVMTLIAERPPLRVAEAGPAFSTPTVVHFSVVMGLAAVLCAPWPAPGPAAGVCAAVGLACVAYVLLVAYRMRVQTAYKPDGEDWTFHCLVPLAAYAVLTAGAVATFARPREALFAIAAAMLLLLFTGVHNTWDAVAFHVARRAQDKN